jgi:transposase-like protein
MAMCPACGSSRIRNDYRPAPLALRIFFIRAFLCDHCNYQFKAFSLMAASSRSSRREAGKSAVFNQPRVGQAVDLTKLKDNTMRSDASERDSQRRAPLRMEVATLSAREAEDQSQQEGLDQEEPHVACGHCGSTNVKRRRRTALERIAFLATNHKAFSCRSCGETFYSKIAPRA